jgi:hypothetical protein
MQFQEAKQQLSLKLDINYSDIANNGLFSDSDLGMFINSAIQDAWDYKPWPFTQKSKTATTSNTPYYDYPQDLMLGSAFLVKVAGKEYKKLQYEDYVKWFEDNSAATDKIWSEWESFIFINQNAYTVGDSVDIYGKKISPQMVNPTDLLPFSPISDSYEYSGNNAIIQMAYAEALSSEKKNNPQQAIQESKQAFATLDNLWKPFAAQRATLQSKNRPMFTPPNFFDKRFPSNNDINVGTFNW